MRDLNWPLDDPHTYVHKQESKRDTFADVLHTVLSH